MILIEIVLFLLGFPYSPFLFRFRFPFPFRFPFAFQFTLPFLSPYLKKLENSKTRITYPSLPVPSRETETNAL